MPHLTASWPSRARRAGPAVFERHLPCFTSLDTAAAFLDVLTAIKAGEIPAPHAAMEVSPL